MKNKKILYQEISDMIKKDIIKGKYPVNTYIPTEIELEEIYDVSKITVRKAIQILCNEGYLIKQSGKGTEVISNRPFNILSKASSFTTILEKNGQLVKKSVLEIKDTEELIDETFKYDRVIEVIRLFEIEGEPAILFKHFISIPKNTEISKISLKNFSLYTFMAALGIQISFIDDQFSAEMPSKEVKERLTLSQDFVLKRIRQSHNKTNELVEHTVAYYDTSKQPYIIDYEV